MISKMNLGTFTARRRIKELSTKGFTGLQNEGANIHWFSIAMDESTDVNNKTQPAAWESSNGI
jgi:hypothetical protein